MKVEKVDSLVEVFSGELVKTKTGATAQKNSQGLLVKAYHGGRGT